MKRVNREWNIIYYKTLRIWCPSALCQDLLPPCLSSLLRSCVYHSVPTVWAVTTWCPVCPGHNRAEITQPTTPSSSCLLLSSPLDYISHLYPSSLITFTINAVCQSAAGLSVDMTQVWPSAALCGQRAGRLVTSLLWERRSPLDDLCLLFFHGEEC